MTSVLLADDHPFMRAGVEAVLRGTRFDIVAMVSDGEEALAAVARHDPDICIFDIRMPTRSGVEALQALRDKADMRPVVLLTAALEDHALLAAVRAGVNGIVLKDGRLYFGDLARYLWSLDAKTGKVIGAKRMGSGINVGSPIIVGKTLVVGSRTGSLYAVRLSDIDAGKDG